MSQFNIIQRILTNDLGKEDVKSILGALRGEDSHAYRDSVAEVFGQVAALLLVSNRLLDNLLLLIIEFSTDLVQAERGTIFLLDTESDELFSRVTNGAERHEIRFPAVTGIAGAVISDGKTLIIHDAYADPRFNAEIDRRSGFKTRNLLAFPLRVNAKSPVIGVLELLNHDEKRITRHELALLEHVSGQAALALGKARHIEQVRQARENEEHLLEVSAAISSELQLKPLLYKIMDAVIQILGCDRATLFLHDEKTNELWSQVALGLQDREIRFPDDRGIAGEVFHKGKPVNIPDAYKDARFNPEIDRQTGYVTRNVLCMPLVNRLGKIIGVTQVLNKKEGPFHRLDENKLQTFSSQAAVAVENAKLFDEVLNMKNYNESILQSLSNGVISVNPMRKIEKCNAIALKTLGVESHHIVGKFADLVFTGDNHWVVDSLRRVIATRDPDNFIDAELTSSTGKKIAVNMAISPLMGTYDQTMGGLLVFEDLTSEKRLKGTLARYMTKEVADQLLTSEAELGGKMQELTILFSDIRHFTTMSEHLGPQETVAMLNEYFTMMVDIVFHEGGILDKFIGDAMLAVFGAPFSSGEDPDRAVRTAIGMQRALARFNKKRIDRGADPIEIGIGINTDTVLVGNIGSMKRMDYTVIGDGVNLASRLETATKFYRAGILISEHTFKNLKYRYRAREADMICVKGKNHPVKIFEIMDQHDIGAFPHMDELLATFANGLAFYRERQWKQAREAFALALTLQPNDHLSSIYLDRSIHFEKTPPPPEWNGVWVMIDK
ncbi:MAG: GAF domain-containing protein [Candidatus Ozemobacteraceae bacterium]